jgi:NAD(P)-dependent dehydrogenase (short-subunit alcohol dehydrogenase family)
MNCERIVVIVPTTGMSGGACYAPQAALAESARILVKSAARQWGASGITVNAVAVEPHWFSIDSSISGPVAIAPRSLSNEVSPVGVVTWLCSEAARDITGQTIVCDGGLWM